MNRYASSHQQVSAVLPAFKALLPSYHLAEPLFELLRQHPACWHRIELKGTGRLDQAILTEKIRRRAQNKRAQIACLFITGPSTSSNFFHELKEYGEDFSMLTSEAPDAVDLTLVLFFVSSLLAPPFQ